MRDSIDCKVFLEYIFCCKERSAGQLCLKRNSVFYLRGFFSAVLAITEWHILEYDLGS